MLYSQQPLHIPDGFLAPWLSIVGWILAALLVGIAVRQTRRQLGERQIPLMGILAAFIFAAQAINFPVAAGTSGHLLGGALAAIVMGPWAACLIMTAVIVVQGLLFQDGGLLVMGWNIINMGILTAFSGYLVYRMISRPLGESRRARLIGAAAGAWVSVEVGAIATAIQLGLSGTSPLGLALPAMAGVHALIGVGEAVITAAAVGFLLATRPDAISAGEAAPGRLAASFTLAGLASALVVAAFSPLASGSPDGLEFIAEQQGFLAAALDAPYEILPDYTVPFIGNEALTTILAVAIGALLVFGAMVLVGRMAARRSAPEG